MTEIINFIFKRDQIIHQYPFPKPAKHTQIPTGKAFNHNSFNLESKQSNLLSLATFENYPFDLLFDVRSLQSHIIVRIYLIAKNGQLFKITSQISRIQLIRQFFTDHSLYQFHITPFTGLIFFQIDFFTFQDFRKSDNLPKIDRILKEIDIEKILTSISRLCSTEKQLKHQNQTYSLIDDWSLIEDWKHNLSVSKIIASTLENKDFEKFTGLKQRNIYNPNRFNSRKMSYFYEIMQSKKYRFQPFFSFELRRSLRQVENQYVYVNSMIKIKEEKSNFERLLIKEEQQKRLNATMVTMIDRNIEVDSIKLLDAELGKLNLTLEKMNQKSFNDKVSFLQSFPRTTEYCFIDKYFKSNTNLPIMIYLSLKQETLHIFLMKNSTVMSLNSKMRIMLQIYSAVNVLWRECHLICFLSNLKDVFVTKNLEIKLRGIEKLLKPEKYMIFEQKSLVNDKLSKCLFYLTQLFFKIFYHHNIVYIRPSADSFILKNPIDDIKLIDMFEKADLGQHLPEQINENDKSFLAGMNYVFFEHLNMVDKMKRKSSRKKSGRKEGTRENERMQDKQYVYQLGHKEDRFFLNTRYVTCWLLKMLEHLTQTPE